MNPSPAVLRANVQVRIAELADCVRQRTVQRLIAALDGLSDQQLQRLCSLPGYDDLPMRGAKVLLQVVGSKILSDFDAEGIKADVRRTRKALQFRL